MEAFVGLTFGFVWGLLVSILPHKTGDHCAQLRFIFLFGGGLLALFGSEKIGLTGAGALAVLTMAFVGGVGWRKQGWGDDNPVSGYLANLWVIFQPILFGLIGTEIQVNE